MSISPKKSNNNVSIPDIDSDLPPRHPPILIRRKQLGMKNLCVLKVKELKKY